MDNHNDTAGKMKLPRALELLNALIENMINDEGGHANRVIPLLLDVGFTAEELVEDFCFLQESVDAETSALKDGGDDDTE